MTRLAEDDGEGTLVARRVSTTRERERERERERGEREVWEKMSGR